MSFSVKDLVAEDIPAIIKLAKENFLEKWSESDYRAEVNRSDSVFLSLYLGAECVGFLLARISPGADVEKEAEVYNVAVTLPNKGKGGGSLLMNEFLDRCRMDGVSKVFLDVRQSNTSAINFYQKFGFREVNRSRDFYSDPQEDSIFMIALLNAGPGS
jgi:[ribosomal protein S18]-alanine N-acetyltransferase